MHRKNIDARELKAKLSYDKETGLFTWLVNTKKPLAGKIAGSLSAHGYWDIRINRTLFKAHRLAWLYIYGCWPRELDHINGERTDNRICNLRECSRSENMQNAALRSNNSTGHVGVSKYKDGRYKARITAFKKTKILGVFDSFDEAVSAYRSEKMKMHEFCPNVRMKELSK